MAPRDLFPRLLGSARGVGVVGWTSAMLAVAEARQLADRRLGSGERQEQIFDRYQRVWTGGLLRLYGVDLELLGEVPPPPAGARLVVANHRTVFDIGALVTSFGGSVLSRGDLEEWPLLGVAAKKAQTIFVDRDNKLSRVVAIREIRRQLDRGRTISVFPEGATYHGDEVRPFNPGAVAACRGLGVEFVPVGLAYPPEIEWGGEESFLEHVMTLGGRRRTRAAMAIGAPFRSDARTGEIAARLEEEVQGLVRRARASLGGAR